jgi:hypothetical protein
LDERAVEMLHENAYWQCFCGFNTFQGGHILEASSLVKTRRVSVDTTVQSKNIAYPTDADLLYRIYSLHESRVAVIKKGKSHPDCKFGAIVALSRNDDGLILSHMSISTAWPM